MTAGTYLSGIDYPGRIILLGYDRAGQPVALYAITGRSENSRNRVLRSRDGMICTEPFDESKVSDPSLIIYSAVRRIGESIIVTNGDHTDTIYDEIISGGDVEGALMKRTYEPDGPIYTPRIAGIIDDAGYCLGIIRKDGENAERLLYRYGKEPGIAHVIHTYEGDSERVEPFLSMPSRVELAGDALEDVWSSLSKGYRVASCCIAGNYVRIINALEDGNGEA